MNIKVIIIYNWYFIIIIVCRCEIYIYKARYMTPCSPKYVQSTYNLIEV